MYCTWNVGARCVAGVSYLVFIDTGQHNPDVHYRQYMGHMNDICGGFLCGNMLYAPGLGWVYVCYLGL